MISRQYYIKQFNYRTFVPKFTPLILFYTVQSLGVLLTECNKQTVKNTNLIILAVKPNIIKSVLKELSPHLTKNHIVLSIAAGVNLRTLEKVRLYFNVIGSVAVLSFFDVFEYYSNEKLIFYHYPARLPIPIRHSFTTFQNQSLINTVWRKISSQFVVEWKALCLLY